MDTMKPLAGYPEFILDSEKLKKSYRDASVERGDYFGNNLRLIGRALSHSLNVLRERADRTQ